MKMFTLAMSIALGVGTGFGQLVTMSPFDIAPPTVYDKVKAISATDPKKTPAEVVELANRLLEKEGIAFIFSLDDASCSTIDKSIKNLKEKTRPLNLSTKLRSVGAEAATLRLPPADFNSGQCSTCSVTLPVFEVTDNDFIALMLGSNIKFHRPANFITAEAFLVDEKDLKVIKTRWRIPYKAGPLGVSYDGNVLYLPLPDPELKHLSLAVFSEGVYQFATREEAESNGKPIQVKDAPVDAANPKNQYLRFDNRGHGQTVKFQNACN